MARTSANSQARSVPEVRLWFLEIRSGCKLGLVRMNEFNVLILSPVTANGFKYVDRILEIKIH